MISITLATGLNNIISKASVNSSGLRSESILLLTLNGPFQIFEGKDLYPSIIDKSEVLFENAIINHLFINRNKKTHIAL